MTSPQWFLVERIADERTNRHGKTTHFLVKWANYPDAESTWEPVARLGRVGWAIQAFREAEEKRRREQRQRALMKAAFESQPAPTLGTPPRQRNAVRTRVPRGPPGQAAAAGVAYRPGRN